MFIQFLTGSGIRTINRHSTELANPIIKIIAIHKHMAGGGGGSPKETAPMTPPTATESVVY